MSKTTEHSDRANALIENWNHVHEAINHITAMSYSLDHNEFGLTVHEKAHQIEALKKILGRINNGLAEEIPAPGEDQL